MLRSFAIAARAARVASPAARAPVARFNYFQSANLFKQYSTQSPLSKDDILARTTAVLKSFEKTSGTAASSAPVTMETTFVGDLGMDSLDYNDVLVALEEEFDVIFDDNTANSIRSVGDCVTYILDNGIAAEEGINHEIR